MPWKIEDVEKHKKGLTPKQKKAWVATANSVRAQCINDGNTEKFCDGKAVRIANGIVKEGAMDRSMDDARRILADTLNKINNTPSVENEWTYVEDMWNDELVYTKGAESYKVSYVIDDAGNVTFGIPVKVIRQTVYTAAESKSKWKEDKGEPMDKWLKSQTKEIQEKFNSILADKLKERLPKYKMEIQSGVIPLIEGKGGNDIVPIKIIQPGWGSSGYYPKEVLERDGSKVFTKGVKMYWNHQTVSEEYERPEGDLDNLAGEFVSDARYEEVGLAGEGLYADAKIFDKYKDVVKDLAPHIGVSIRASGIAEEGEVNGERGMVIEELLNARSVDFVTVPGAGGKVIEMFESMGRKINIKERVMEQELKVANDKIAEQETALSASEEALKLANEKVAQFNEAILLKEAADFVTAELAEVEMPDVTKERLAKKLSAKPVPAEDKTIDKEAWKAVIGEAVKDELDYLGKVVGSGTIKDMGESTAAEETKQSFAESMAKLYESQGKSKEEAKRLAEIGEK